MSTSEFSSLEEYELDDVDDNAFSSVDVPQSSTDNGKKAASDSKGNTKTAASTATTITAYPNPLHKSLPSFAHLQNLTDQIAGRQCVNGYMRSNEEDTHRKTDERDSDSFISSDESDYQALSDLDDLLNEGLPEDLRGPRSLKKSKDEILHLIRGGGINRKNNVGTSDNTFLDDTDDCSLAESPQNSNKVQDELESSKLKSEIYNTRDIVALDEKGKNPLEVLPKDWVEIRHLSGMPLYLHRGSRVCTWSKPYELRTGSARKHCIPVSGIPCFSYRRALDREAEQSSMQQKIIKRNFSEAFESDTNEISQEDQLSTRDDLLNPESECISALNSMLDIVSFESDRNGSLPLLPSAPGSNPSGDNAVPQTSGSSNKCLLSPNKKILSGSSNQLNQGSSDTLKGLLPCARVETARENNSVNSLHAMEFRAYCQKLFKFKHTKCVKFKSWKARRKYHKDVKRLHLQRPTLPDGVKLITFSVQNSGDADGPKGNKEYVMNPQGKSSVCILHEYVQHALRTQPTYIFEELENANTPYSATVQINGVNYASGLGSSKKQAKAAAAKATLELMIPEMKDDLNDANEIAKADPNHSQFFDQVGLDDPRIAKMCANISEPSPYALLLTCIQRNFGQSACSSIKFSMVSSANQTNRFRMETGEYSAEVSAANKRDGKQLASQALLAKIHPQIKKFSSFISLYGNNSVKSVKEKKKEEQQITTLQSKASANSPNYAILAKLREEMRKLKEEDSKLTIKAK